MGKFYTSLLIFICVILFACSNQRDRRAGLVKVPDESNFYLFNPITGACSTLYKPRNNRVHFWRTSCVYVVEMIRSSIDGKTDSSVGLPVVPAESPR